MSKEFILNYGYEDLKCYDVKQETKKKGTKSNSDT